MGLPLPTLTFVRMADVNPAAATIDAMLDAIYTAVTAANDYRGTAVPATHQWTWARYVNVVTEAVYASAPPVGTPMLMNPQLILCGANPAPGALTANDRISDGAIVASQLYAGINKSGGAYNAYGAALPFTSGRFFGYWKADTISAPNMNAVTTIVRAYISEETVLIQIIGVTTTQQNWIYFGAIVEPYSPDIYLSSEIDNRLYGLQCGGILNSTTFLSNSSLAACMFDYNQVAGQMHSGVFSPDNMTSKENTIPICRRLRLLNTPTAAALTTPSGKYVGSFIDQAFNGSSSGTDWRTGTLRGPLATGLVMSGRYLRNGGADVAHFVAMSDIAAAQGIILKAVP